MKKIKTGSVISHIYLILLTFVSIFPLGVDLDFVRKGQGGADGQSDGLLAKDMDP